MSYRWSKEGKPLTGDNNILIVRPQSEKDFGTYTCNVTNIAGSTVHQIRLEEQKQSSEVKAQGEEGSKWCYELEKTQIL